MAGAARVGDNILGSDGGEHMSHFPPHDVTVLSGRISGGSGDVFINGMRAAFAGSHTIETDECCGGANDGGSVRNGSATVFINGRPAARIGDSINTHVGYANITTGSSNVIIG